MTVMKYANHQLISKADSKQKTQELHIWAPLSQPSENKVFVIFASLSSLFHTLWSLNF